MISIVYLHEPWFSVEHTEFENRIYRQLKGAFGVGQLVQTTPDEIEEELAALPGRRVFLVPPWHHDFIDHELADYQHPDDAVYVFGSAECNLTAFLDPNTDVVTVTTPQECDMFGSSAAAIVVYDRHAKTSMGARTSAVVAGSTT